MLQEFMEFAFKGNVFNLAVAVVIGTAFAKITSSLVANIITPLLGIVLGGIDISSKTAQVGNATVEYGLFIQATIDFLIIAIVLFLIIHSFKKFQDQRAKEEEEVAEDTPAGPTQEELLEEIRDAIKDQAQ